MRKSKAPSGPCANVHCPACGAGLEFEVYDNEPPGTEFSGNCSACGASLVFLRLCMVYGGWTAFTEQRFQASRELLYAHTRQGF